MVEEKSSIYHGLDDKDTVRFYEQEFYVLSNFSSFSLKWKEIKFDTLEAAYHWEKFVPDGFMGSVCVSVRQNIIEARSAHDAFQLAQVCKGLVRPDWNNVKVDIMRQLLWEKVRQHKYVKQKLLETGDRLLVENSWRDTYWGEGPNKDGKNMLGVLWMEIRESLREELVKE